jgi:hypothetical protein
VRRAGWIGGDPVAGLGVCPSAWRWIPRSCVAIGAITRCLTADPTGAAAGSPPAADLLRSGAAVPGQAFYGDLDPAAADAAIALLTPDTPAGIGLGTTTLTADGWGSVPRTYVVCTQDMTIRPALQQRFIADADAAFPANPTTVHALHASHSPFLSMPGQVADIAMNLRR